MKHITGDAALVIIVLIIALYMGFGKYLEYQKVLNNCTTEQVQIE